MSNPCENVLIIDSSDQGFLDWVLEEGREKGLFSLFVPEPDSLGPEVSDVLDWRYAHWGCRLEPIGEGIMRCDSSFDGRLRLGFFTPNDPPTIFFRRLCEDPRVSSAELYFHEPGMNFCGACYSGGVEDWYETTYDGGLAVTNTETIPEQVVGELNLELIEEVSDAQ